MTSCRIIQRIALIVLGTLAGAVLAEILLRLFFPISFPQTPPWMQAWLYHEQLGWVTRPNLIEYGWPVSNNQGLRGPEVPLERKPGNSRVVILGDSFGYGFGVRDYRLCFPSLLNSEYFPDTEFVNLSVSGYGTDQEYLYFKLEGYRYHADLVILIFHPNDFPENLIVYDNGLVSPNFDYNSKGELQLVNVPVPLVPGWGEDWIQPVSAREWLFKKSELAQLWYSYRVSHLPRTPWQDSTYPTREFLKKAKNTREILRLLNQEVVSSGAKFLIVTTPYTHMIREEEWSETKSVLKLEERDRFGPYEDFFTPLEKEGIVVVHLNRPLLELTQKGNELYAKSHGHWNPTGHKAVAALLAKVIEERGIFSTVPVGSAP